MKTRILGQEEAGIDEYADFLGACVEELSPLVARHIRALRMTFTISLSDTAAARLRGRACFQS